MLSVFDLFSSFHIHEHTVCSLLSLASLTYHNVFRVQPYCSMHENFVLHSLLLENNILLYKHITLYSSLNWFMNTWVASTFRLF